MASFGETRRAARGRWSYVISCLAGDLLDEAIKENGKKHVACPVHGTSARPPFRIFKDFEETGGVVCSNCGMKADGFATLGWLLNIDVTEARNRIADLLGVSDPKYQPTVYNAPPPPPQPPEPPPPEPDMALKKRLADMWRTAVPLSDAQARPARQYLINRGVRGLKELPQCLRYHPMVPYYEPDGDDSSKMVKTGEFPAILAAVYRQDGQIAALHRTYITEKGFKALVPEVKKLSGVWDAKPLSGAFIPLAQRSTVLGVTEGIETALAVSTATFMPMWACVSASLMPSIWIPEEVRTVVIWADHDRSNAGMAAAEKLQERLLAEGRQVIIALPGAQIPDGAKGIDWMDMLREYGPESFPYRDLDDLDQGDDEEAHETHEGGNHGHAASGR